jgi:hypothetical protein
VLPRVNVIRVQPEAVARCAADRALASAAAAYRAICDLPLERATQEFQLLLQRVAATARCWPFIV